MEERRVLHVIGAMNKGGAETMVMNIYRNIDREKIQFDFLCLSNEIGSYDEEIIKLGGNIYKLPAPKEQGRFKNFYSIYKIMKEKGPYIAVHSHIMFYNGYINLIAYIAKINKRISHSHSSNDLKKENIVRKVYIKFSRFLTNRFSNVKIACGDEAGVYLYGNKQKFINLKNGIDLELYDKVEKKDVDKLKLEMGIQNETLVIGHGGRFEDVKNQKYFIDLANTMKKKKMDFKIVLVGNGSKFQEISNLIKENGLEENFVLSGVRSDIPVFMKMFDVFLMPSLYEGFPLTLVEALIGDCICYLSKNVPKETNIIDSRINYFDLDIDKEKLVNEIQEKLKNKNEINIKEELIRKGFSIKNMVEEMSQIYLGT